MIIPRGYHSQSSSQELFKILYLGRDEFSCVVLEELHKATGTHLTSVIVD